MANDGETLFGKIAITHKFMTPKQINECLDIQARIRTYGLGDKKIGKIAVERKFLTEQQLQLILNIQRAVLEEKRKKEEAARPKPAPATRPKAKARAAAPPVLKPPPHRIISPAPARPKVDTSSAPAARSRIEEYTAQIRMGRITTIVVVGILAIVAVIVLASLKGRDAGDNNQAGPADGSGAPLVQDQNAAMAAEQERVRARHESEAQQLYMEIKDWASKNRDKKEEIINRCNRIAVDYAETEAATSARLLADFYAELPEMPKEALVDRQSATQASQIYMRLSMQALKLRAREQWAKAIEVYEQFPDTFKETPFYPKIRGEINKLRALIAEKYAADLRTINRLVAAKRYEEAREYLAKIENYASHDLVIAVQKELDSFIAEAREAPTPVTAARSKDVMLAEKLRIAESMFWRNMYDDALKSYKALAENTEFMTAHKEVRGRIRDLERIISVLDAAAKDIIKSKGRKRTIYFEKRGSVFAEVIDVHERVILAYEKGRGNFEIPLADLTTNSLLLFAKKHLPPRSAETEMALATFYLSRGLAKKAEEYVYKAAKRDAPNDEVARLLERLEEKPPDIIEEGIASAPKDKPEDSTEAGKLFSKAQEHFKKGEFAKARALYRDLQKRFPASPVVSENKARIEANLASCEENLSSPLASVFSGKVIERKDLGKAVVEVSYDFENDKQLADWKEYNWYSIFDMHDSNWHITDGELQGNGSRGFLWKGEIDGDVKVEFDAYSTSSDRQNIQATICDNGEGWNYLFAIGLTELGDPKDIIRRNEKFSFGKEIAKRSSEAKSFKTYHIKIIRKSSELSLYVDDKLTLKSKHSLYKKGHVGLFAIGSTVRFDNISITGRLDKQWLKKHGK